MIRINLIAERKKLATAKPERRAGTRDLGLWLLVAAIGLGLLATGYWYWSLSSRLAEKDRQIAEAQKEADELGPIIREVEQFKLAQAELERKIDIIQVLRDNQQGPVRLMDEISRALPDLLWLTRATASATVLDLSGSAFNPNAVANFMDNLDAVEEFQEPILKEIRQQANGTYTFTISLSYSYARSSRPEEG